MDQDFELLFDAPSKIAFLAKSALVKLFVPQSASGVYFLMNEMTPFYVGRSDYCVRTRLLNHPLLPLASHVVWEQCKNPTQAFRMESAWFHTLQATHRLKNRIHPASPAGLLEKCPFCSTRDCLAWTHALRPLKQIGAVPLVASDLLAVAAKTIGA